MSEVGQLLAERKRTGSKRGHREDDAHLALVLEGGGMRGVVSIGMASVFEERGYFDAFDSVHGSSAGACGGAYFVARQSSLGASIYYEDINNTEFIDLKRPLFGRPIMNRAFLVDHVMQHVKPLAAELIVGAPGFLNVVVTSADTGEGMVVNTFRSRDHLFDVLRATICLPVIAGRDSMIDGRRFVDGGLAQQIAIPSAIEAGATHVVALMTRAADETERKVRGGSDFQAQVLSFVYGKRVRDAYIARNPKINALISAIEVGRVVHDARSIEVDGVIRPSSSGKAGRLTVDGERLRRVCQESRAAALKYLETSATSKVQKS